MGNPVPYTTADSLSEEDKKYLGARVSNSPAIAQLLDVGKSLVDIRQLAQKLDQDAGVTRTDYESEVIDGPDPLPPQGP